MLASSWLSGRILDWHLSQPGFDLSFGNPACLATLMSSDRMKQICHDWQYIYIYIYIYIHIKILQLCSECEFYDIPANYKWCNNSHTSSTHIDLYDIPHIFYTRIIDTHCLQTLTGYYEYIHIYIYIYIIMYR